MAPLGKATDVSLSEDNLVPIPEDVISHESGFVGDAATRRDYARLTASYDPDTYWQGIHEWNLQVVAERGKRRQRLEATNGDSKREREDTDIPDAPLVQRAKTTTSGVPPRSNILVNEFASVYSHHHQEPPNGLVEPTTPDPAEQRLRNPYEDIPLSKKLSETLECFLARLPPSTTPLSAGPWIWIANPHAPSHSAAPESGTSPADVGTLRQRGFALLETFQATKSKDRTRLERDIHALARRTLVTAGKWLLFPRAEQVDDVWRRVARGVWAGELGTAAKAATYDADEPRRQQARLVCVYTADFADRADVRRVLVALRRMGLVDDGSAVYYKCDAYTYLDITSGNPFKLRASMYSSRDMLAREDGTATT